MWHCCATGRPAIDPPGGPRRQLPHDGRGRRHCAPPVCGGRQLRSHFLTEGCASGVTLGPKRVLPVALIATEAAGCCSRRHWHAQAAQHPRLGGNMDRALCAWRLPDKPAMGITSARGSLAGSHRRWLHPMAEIVRAADRKPVALNGWSNAAVQLAGVTPSDASHALGRVDAWDGKAAQKALGLLRAARTGRGRCWPLISCRYWAQMIVISIDRTDQYWRC